MTFEVIESHWNELEDQMTKVTNVDNVIDHHVKFLDACMRDCMISSEQFLDIHKILAISASFSDFVQAITRDTKKKEEDIKQTNGGSRTISQEQRKMVLQVSRVDFIFGPNDGRFCNCDVYLNCSLILRIFARIWIKSWAPKNS